MAVPDAARADAIDHAAAYEAAADDVRRFDKDRFLSCLFMPEPARRHVLAILAFSTEIARVRDVVSDPLPGEVRLQWWRDLLESPSPGAGGTPPIVEALIDTITRYALPMTAFMHLIDARVFDLYDDLMPTLNDLEGYCGETVSSLIQLSAIILADGNDPGTAESAGHAGVAYGLTGLLRALPFHAARGQIYMPKDLLEKHGAVPSDILAGRLTPELSRALKDLRAVARDHLVRANLGLKSVPSGVKPAFLPLALVEPMLDLMDRPGYDPFRTLVDLPQWRKQLRLWWVARRMK